MALRKFTNFGAAARSEVTLRVNQSIFISNSMLHKCKAINVKAVYLYVDDERPIIGIKFIDQVAENDKECRKVSREKSGVSLNIAPILKFYNINKQSKKKTMSSRIEGELLIVDLFQVKD